MGVGFRPKLEFSYLNEIVRGGPQQNSLQVTHTPRANDQHAGFVVVDNVEQHVSGILRVPCLAMNGDIKFSP